MNSQAGMSIIAIYQLMDGTWETEELYSTDTDDNETLDSVLYFNRFHEEATDQLYSVLNRVEEAVTDEEQPTINLDEKLYLQVADWTKTVSGQLGQMRIAFNALHSHYQSRVRLEKAKLRQLDSNATRSIEHLRKTYRDHYKHWEDWRIQYERERKALNDELNKQIEDRMLEEESLKDRLLKQEKTIARLTRQISSFRKLHQTNEETSIKQRPRRCSFPSVVDLTT